MNTKTLSKEEQKKALLDLVKDIHCFEPLKQWNNGNNIFEILKIGRTEIRHSNMLAWLLDPNETHGLGSEFLYDFIATISNIDGIDANTVLKLLTSDLDQAKVKREWNDIDILLEFPLAKVVVAIENKIGAHEHKRNGTDDSQLTVYSRKLNEYYDTYSVIQIFLTPDGEEPSVTEWFVLTYTEIIENLQTIIDSKKQTLDNVSKILIENYIEIIKKKIIMDAELITICNEIYNKHKVALDLIYENKDDVTDCITRQLTTLCNKNADIIYSAKTLKFKTKNLFSSFNGLLNDNDYFYQITNRKNDITLELVFHKERSTTIQNDTINKINNWIEKDGSKIKKPDDWKEWKRAWSRTKTFDNINDDELYKWLNDKINEIIKREDKLINKKQ